MATVTKGVSRFVDMHPSVAGIHKLFSAFLRMVGPLVHNRSNPPLSQPNSDAATQRNEHTNLTRMATPHRPADIGNSIYSNVVQGGVDLPDQGVASQDGQVAADDELVWDLIDSQPWLGWMRSDALTGNPASNWLL